MNTIQKNSFGEIYRKICIAMLWAIALYSAIIQHKYFQIPYAMLVFGISVLLFYFLSQEDKQFVYKEVITKESTALLFFMAYMLLIGFLFSPDRNGHLSQWLTCMEYLFLLIVIVSLIRDSGTDAFHTLLFIKAIILGIVFILEPVDFRGRLSISADMNPNGLGMEFVTGIWATLYGQQKKKIPLMFSAVIFAFFGYCIMMTGSRKALIATGIVLIFWLFFCFLPSLKEKDSFQGMFSLIMLVVLIIIIGKAFLDNYAESNISERMNDLFYEVSEGERSNMYRVGYEMFKINPLFGIGFHGFEYYYGSYSHATVVEIPVSGGIVGTLIYFIGYYISIKKVYTVYRQTKGIKVLSSEHLRAKMSLILWAIMLFYTICIIHPYQMESYILFGIIFGDTSYIENRVLQRTETIEKNKIRSKYFKYV